LEESHFLELKRELAPGKGANKETARDLAQLAIDGGTLIVGVEELPDKTLQRAPQPLPGLPERVEQIAQMVVDPPLSIITRTVPTKADITIGYLIIHVPASPAAPHMVDGRYYGRGDRTKRILTDPEVLRLHAQRSRNELDALALLGREIERDIFVGGEVGNAHGFFVAEPANGRRDMLLSLTDEPGRQRINEMVNMVLVGPVTQHLQGVQPFAPDLSDFTSHERRAEGMAMTTYGIAPGRRPREQDGFKNMESSGELELQDNGGVRIYTSRLSWTNPDGSRLLTDDAVVALAHRLIALTVGIAEEVGYFGNWALAFGARGLRDTYSSRLARSMGWVDPRPFAEDAYERAVAASYADLTSQPRELVDQLVGSLLRGYGTRHLFLSSLKS